MQIFQSLAKLVLAVFTSLIFKLLVRGQRKLSHSEIMIGFMGKQGCVPESPGHVSLPLKQAHPSDSANGAGNAGHRSLGEDSLLSKEAPNDLH